MLKRFGLGISTRLDASTALDEAIESALESAGATRADAAIVLATPSYGLADLVKVPGQACDRLGTERMAGGAVEGLAIGAREIDAEPGMAVWVGVGIEAEPVWVEPHVLPLSEVGRDVVAQAGGELMPGDLLLSWLGAGSAARSELAGGLGSALRGGQLMGLIAAESSGDPLPVWAGLDSSPNGLAGLVLRACDAEVRLAISCRPVSPPLRVTRTRGRWIHGLDGGPALDRYCVGLPEALAQDLPRAARTRLIAQVRPGETGESDRVNLARIRRVVGFDPEQRALSLSSPVETGDSIALVSLDESAARDALKQLADPAPRTGAGIYFTCRARGRRLFGHEGLEMGYLGRHFQRPDALLGAVGPALLGTGGPPDSGVELLTYAGLLGLVATD
jgi:small ligand-binding sensory domain FIST